MNDKLLKAFWCMYERSKNDPEIYVKHWYYTDSISIYKGEPLLLDSRKLAEIRIDEIKEYSTIPYYYFWKKEVVTYIKRVTGFIRNPEDKYELFNFTTNDQDEMKKIKNVVAQHLKDERDKKEEERKRIIDSLLC